MTNHNSQASLPSSPIGVPASETKLQPLSQKPQVAFISGHVEVGDDYFKEHYVAKIQTAVSEGHYFVIGPAPGIDTIALHFLVNEAQVDPSRITVYFAEFQKKALDQLQTNLIMDGYTINTKIEGITTAQRDEAMTRDSDYDILRFMTEDEQRALYGHRYYPRISNTEKNYRRRHGLPLHENAAFAAPRAEHVPDWQLANEPMSNSNATVVKKRWKTRLFGNWL
ncbi:hypothetical protein BJ165DRAFT_1404576 [Panaeolus papilionaceus]|nr:hypothetical protein BJ165DRAFT_1404576 [Panaeolus papilionaceus]